MDLSQLKHLEKFFYKALDKTKDIKFLQQFVRNELISTVEADSDSLWNNFGIPVQKEVLESESDESSLEFESSFYKSKKNTEVSIELNDSSISQ